MDHPSLKDLVQAPMAPSVTEHVDRCARCRVEVRLYRSATANEEIYEDPSCSESPEQDLLDHDLPEPGTRLRTPLGDLEVTARIGSGGFGDVLLAERVETGESFAIKVAREVHPALRARVQREFEVGRALCHPNVLSAVALIEVQGRPSLVTPYVPGPSAEIWLGRRPPSPPEALALVDGVLAGLAHAHAHGVIHRDLKPSNVLLDPRSGSLVPVVADFGLARLREGALPTGPGPLRTRTGAWMGTLAYCAPEQLRDASRVDPRADLFSVGCLLYVLLARSLPFSAQDPVSLHEAIVKRAYAPLSSVVPEVEPSISLLVDALLSPSPEDRPANAEQVRAALRSKADLQWSPVSLEVARAEAARVRGLRLAARHRPPAEPLVGRSGEIAGVLARLGGGMRRLTLHGPAGVGKTALCRAILAHRSVVQASWPGGAWFVHAAACRDAVSVALASAVALGVRVSSSDAVGDLVGLLAVRGPTLLVLDEVELCVEGAREVLDRLLLGAPSVHVLCTSRRPLGASDERVIPVEPLGVEDAVALFSAQVRRARGGKSLDPSEADSVRALVSRLDGLPLALELAAGRSARMSPADLLSRLDRRLQLLTSGETDDRHASLARALSASWEALEADAQRMLARVSVFAGPFEVDAAEHVLADPSLFADDLLGVLVERAMLQIVETAAGPRFRLLESVRAYAELQLGPARAEVWALHRDYFLERGGALAEQVQRAARDRDIRALASWLPELSAVIDRFPEPEVAVRSAVIGAVGAFWTGGDGLNLLDRAQVARNLLGDTPLAWSYDLERLWRGGPVPDDLRERLRAWTPLLRAVGTASTAVSLVRHRRLDEVLSLVEEARTESVLAGFPCPESRCAVFEAIVIGFLRGPEAAEPLLRNALARLDLDEQPVLCSEVLSHLIDAILQRGGDAGELARQLVRTARRGSDPVLVARASWLQGIHLCRSRALGEGLERLERSFEEAEALGAGRAARFARLALGEFQSGAAGEAIARAVAEEAESASGEPVGTARIARAQVAMHAAIDGRTEGAEAAFAAAASHTRSPLILAWVTTARAVLASASRQASHRDEREPLPSSLPPGLRRALEAIELAAGVLDNPEQRVPARLSAGGAVAGCEPHVSFYAHRLLALLDSVSERAR